MIYMLCYDVSDPKRLRKVARLLENFGIRVQKSFFQCEMNEKKLKMIEKQMLSVINIKKDYFYIYPLCEICSKKALTDGTGSLIQIENFEIL